MNAPARPTCAAGAAATDHPGLADRAAALFQGWPTAERSSPRGGSSRDKLPAERDLAQRFRGPTSSIRPEAQRAQASAARVRAERHKPLRQVALGRQLVAGLEPPLEMSRLSWSATSWKMRCGASLRPGCGGRGAGGASSGSSGGVNGAW